MFQSLSSGVTYTAASDGLLFVNPSEGVPCSGYSYQEVFVDGVRAAYVKGYAPYGSMGAATVPIKKGSQFSNVAAYGCPPQLLVFAPLSS